MGCLNVCCVVCVVFVRKLLLIVGRLLVVCSCRCLFGVGCCALFVVCWLAVGG